MGTHFFFLNYAEVGTRFFYELRRAEVGMRFFFLNYAEVGMRFFSELRRAEVGTRFFFLNYAGQRWAGHALFRSCRAIAFLAIALF